VAINLENVKKLRSQTGAGILDCKEALSSTGDDFNKAIEWLKKKGLSRLAKKSGRLAGEGLVHSYIHGGGRIGVLIEVNSETDFVARNEEFKKFVNNVTAHIVAMDPLYINEADIPLEVIQKEKDILKEQAKQKGKNVDVTDRIADGLYKKWLSEVCLLDQEFIGQDYSDKPQIVKDVLNDLIVKMGENIVIRRFIRYDLGGTTSKQPAPANTKNQG